MRKLFPIIFVTLSFFGLNCLACYSVPPDLMKEPKVQFRLAKKVFLGKVVAVSPSLTNGSVSKNFGTSFPVVYKIMLIERIKGNARNTELISGEVDGVEFISSSQQEHKVFRLLGSSSITSDCKRAPPSLLVGATYLIFLSDYPDTKDFERIDSSEDSWLLTVRGLGQ